MHETSTPTSMQDNLATYGSDLARWPAERVKGVREALLGDMEFRREWEAARDLDRAMDEAARGLDEDIGRAGALQRIRARTLARVAARPFAGMKWQRIAAAVVVAGMLGGAMDIFLVEPEAENLEFVALDLLLYGPDDSELR